MTLFLLCVFQVSALLLVGSCICRAYHTHKGNTRRPVRWTFSALSVVACLSLFGPWFGYEPDGVSTALIGVLTLTQLVTSHYWRAGVPRQFSQEDRSP